MCESAELICEYDGKFTVTYSTLDMRQAGQESAFRATKEADKIFAAAPDLLAALKLMRTALGRHVQDGDGTSQTTDAMYAANQAIAKAVR